MRTITCPRCGAIINVLYGNKLLCLCGNLYPIPPRKDETE